MSRIRGIRRFLHIPSGGASITRAVDDELRFHFEMTMRDLMNSGMSPEDAEREAHRRFGDVDGARARLARIDRARATSERRAEWWSAAAQDLRYALRGLRLKPAFAAGVILTLGLGIGANAAMFGIVDRLLFRPPAYLAAPERTHRLYFARLIDGKEFVGGNAQYQRMLDIAKESKSMELIGGYSENRRAIGTGEAAREMEIGSMSANLWRLFDAHPLLGRFFTEDEDRYPEVSRVVVLSYGYWQSQYAGARDVIGKTMSIGPGQYTIIGVAPRGFAAVEMVTPIGFIPLTASATDGFGAMWSKYHATYNMTWLTIFGRLRPGVTTQAAAADLTNAYQASWRAQSAIQPKTPKLEIVKPRVIVSSVLAQRGPSPSADTKVATWLLGVTSVVLLIACANVGNLLLARAFGRRREIAVRLALGVSRGRLVSQLLIESLLLAVIGAAVGIAIAQWGGQILRSTLMPQVEWGNALADTRVLLFAGGTALGAGLLAGLAPVFQAGRSDVAATLKAGAREGHGQRSRLRTTLLVLQAALSVILLVGAGLFVRSVRNVQSLHLGYDPERLVWIEPHMRGVKMDSAQAVALRRDLVERALRDPAVQNAAVVMTVPFSSTYSGEMFAVGADSVRFMKDVMQQPTTASYFATTGTRLLRGRGILSSDRPGTPLVMVVSETFARMGWPAQDAIGKCVRMEADTMPCRTVVGVAEDAKFGGLDTPSDPVAYYPLAQDGENHGTLFIRVRDDASLRAEGLRRELQSLMPGASYLVATPLTDILAPATRSWRLGATMFAIFGGLALVLAGIGLYSVVAYSVTQRTHEMGVRVALGARVGDVVRLIVGDGLRVVVAGVAIGLVLAFSAGHWLAPLLFNVSARDPIVFTAVAVVLVAVAVAASWLPAVRAARVDPSTALRAD